MPKWPNKIEARPIWQWLFINIAAVVIGAFLFWSAYGVVAGFFVARPLAAESEALLTDTLTQEQLKALKEGRLNRNQMLDILQRQDKEGKVFSMHAEQFKKVPWSAVNPFVSAVVFGFVGLASGLLKMFRYVGIIPLLLLSVTFPVLTSTSSAGGVINVPFTVWLSVLVQFLSVYLFARCGLALRNRFSRQPGSSLL